MKRQGIRYTTLAVIICASVTLVDIAGNRINDSFKLPWNSVNMAAIPGLVAIFTFGIGNVLVCISNIFSSERMLLAGANSMNLMEDRKKADMSHHLEVLWDRVFKYEANLRNQGIDTDETERITANRAKLRESIANLDSECKEHFGILHDDVDEFVEYVARFRPFSQQMPATREGFIATAGFAIPEALPQKLQEALSGCDLSLVEDWYDGGVFTISDRKLQEQFVANKTIRAIRETIGITLSVKFSETLIGHPVPLWHALTMKKIGTSVGTLMAKMNRKYVKPTEPEFFDAQHFLWNDEQNDLLILQGFGDRGEDVLADVRQARRRLFRDTFSNDRLSAHTQICRMFGRDFVNAMDLRLDYDIEFAVGMLDHTPIEDIQNLAKVVLCPIYPEAKVDLKSEQAISVLYGVNEFIERNIPAVFDNPLELRTARIGAMVNHYNVRQIMRASPEAAVSIFRDRILPLEPRYTKQICLLRQHYELARLQLLSYVGMLDELAQYELIVESEGGRGQAEAYRLR
ncbi:MAG: hypothetical protein ISS70_03000 [Phycisphaerae bacterium]|nr:hypothetical protein [Phycisphaerae bacterium]